jgi:hypothetical protein
MNETIKTMINFSSLIINKQIHMQLLCVRLYNTYSNWQKVKNM